MKVSALWITKNEEANIALSIESTLAIADEVVVVDTGSTDRTAEIARGLGARVVSYVWADDFAAARNFALAQTSGDVVLFPDADEWFCPPLTQRDRDWLENEFLPSGAHAVTVERENIDPDTDLLLSKDGMMRIVRGKASVDYIGIVHERLRVAGGARIRVKRPGDICIRHSGYGRENTKQKAARNLQLLQRAFESEPDDRDARALTAFYLMREYLGLERRREACVPLHWLLDNPKRCWETLRRFSGCAYVLPFAGIQLASAFRAQFSGAQVRRVLVQGVVEFFPAFAGSAVAELYYGYHFGCDGDELLQKLPAAVQEAEKLRQENPPDASASYLTALSELYSGASVAALRRGQREQAFEYAVKSVTGSENDIPTEAVATLLRCVKGLPLPDVLSFLNRVLPVDKRGMMLNLLSYTQYEGCTDVYLYYMKKIIDAGWARKADFHYMLSVAGKHAEAVAAARGGREGMDDAGYYLGLFIAVACAENEGLYREGIGGYGPYEAVLRAMFGGAPLAELDMAVASECYKLLAFAAGRPLANRFLALYARSPQLCRACFEIQQHYYTYSGLYAEFMDESLYEPKEDDYPERLQIAECRIMAGEYAEALAAVEDVMFKMPAVQMPFELCQALNAQAPPDIAQRAKALYDTAAALFGEFTAMRDAGRTGVVFEYDTKQDRKKLAATRPSELLDMSRPAAGPLLYGTGEHALKAAGAYLAVKSYAAAVRCCCRALAARGDEKEARRILAAVFEAVGNAEMLDCLTAV